MKKIVLFTVFFLFLMIRSVSANCGGTTACNCGDMLTSSYNMTSDLTNSTGGNICPGDGIDIGANNIILDCEGHTINGINVWGNSGIFNVGYTKTTVKNCIVKGFWWGIFFGEGSGYCTFTNNTVISSGDLGIYLSYGPSYNTFTNNNVSSNGNGGIGLYAGPSYNNFTNNIVSSNTNNGIALDYSSNYNTLINNTINSNNNSGIYISSSSSNTITNNIANSNTNYGIELESSNNNSMYNNYLSNSINAVDNGNNFWNITETLGTNIIGGPYLGGNYWSDYNGVDTSNPSDGIGETLVPYTSNGNIVNGGDYLPLTTRFTIHCGDNLTSSYNMTSDLTNCPENGININASNIILDCQGHTINGNNPGYPYSGINNGGVFVDGWPGGYDNVTIKNCIITGGFDSGIMFVGASYGNIINNTASSNEYGFHVFWNALYNNLINNIATNNNLGFRIAYTSYDTLVGNIANNNNYGIGLDAPSYINLINNTANNNNYVGITIANNNYNNLTNNTANNNHEYGIDLVGAHYSNIINNTANNNYGNGIYLTSSSSNTITNNTANSNAGYGIYVTGSTSNTFANNVFNSNTNASVYLEGPVY